MRLKNSRYEEIKSIIADVLEDYNITSFPVNIDYLASKLNIVFIYESGHLKDFDGTTTSDEIGLPVSETGLVLPCGASGRFEGK